MNDLFLNILNMSLTASYVAAAVMIARLLLKKAPKIFSYSLWGIVLFRLICPFSFESELSLLLMKPDTAMQNFIPAANPPPIIQPNQSHQAISDAIYQNAVNPPTPSLSEIIMRICMVIWIVGMVVLLSYSIISYLRLKHRMSNATSIGGNLYESELIQTPFVLGFLKPKIILSAGIPADELDYILVHEKTHIRRLDYLVKPLAFLAVVLHWFNPIVWLCYFLMIKDMEAFCDEAVMKQTKEDIRKSYSSSLLSLSAIQSGFLSPLAFGESNVKFRIKNILQYKKPAFWGIALSVVAVIAVGIALIANPIGVRVTNIDSKMLSNMVIGAEMPYMIYADEEKAIFLNGIDVFIYDLKHATMHRAISVQNLRSNSFLDTTVTVLKDGSKLYIQNYDTKKNAHEEYMYEYDIKRNRLKKIPQREIEDKFVFEDAAVEPYASMLEDYAYHLSAAEINSGEAVPETFVSGLNDYIYGGYVAKINEDKFVAIRLNGSDFWSLELVVYSLSDGPQRAYENLFPVDYSEILPKIWFHQLNIYDIKSPVYQTNSDGVEMQIPNGSYRLLEEQMLQLQQTLEKVKLKKASDKVIYDMASDIELLSSRESNKLSLYSGVEKQTYLVLTNSNGEEIGKYFAPLSLYEDVKNFMYEAFVNELLLSAQLENDLLSFTIPTLIPETHSLFLQISGRQKMGENDAMSFHAFEKETEERSFEAGKTYTLAVSKDSLLECEMYVELQDQRAPAISPKGSISFLDAEHQPETVTPPMYAIVTQGNPVPQSCTHFEWEHTFDSALIEHVGAEKFNEEIKQADHDFCGSTIYDYMDKFEITTDEFLQVTKKTSIYKEMEKYRKELTNFTLAQAPLPTLDYRLELIMTDGIFQAGRTMIPGGDTYETNYCGSYELQTKLGDKIVDKMVLPRDEYSNFEQFDILADDYNNDGNLDFTLGSWGSSNGKIYKLYSVSKEGKLSRLSKNEFLVANHDFSIRFEKLSPTSFTYEWYNNNIAENVTETYVWENSEFVSTKK